MPRIQLETPRRQRRPQAERTATTRAKIIRAVIEAIDAGGFRNATANEIAHRAGVTWGAVQHHFGGKEGILVAVLEDSFNRFADRVGSIDPDDAPARRVSQFVERAWEHFASPHYRCTIEILLNYAGTEDPAPQPWQSEMLNALDRTWGALFRDARIDRARSVAPAAPDDLDAVGPRHVSFHQRGRRALSSHRAATPGRYLAARTLPELEPA